MFSSCRFWRRKMTQRDEGTLPMWQWGRLEKHLSRCAECRLAQEADQALHTVLRTHSGMLTPSRERDFDDKVLAAYYSASAPLAAPGQGLWERINLSLPFRLPTVEFFLQLSGGALLAASVTAIFFLSALHGPTRNARTTGNGMEVHEAFAARNDPPIPLESLLQSQAPRAALLWTAPSTPHFRLISKPRAH